MLIVDGKLKTWDAVDGTKPADTEFDDLFADMGIGRGIVEYERGKKILKDYRTLTPSQYKGAIEELRKWCEVI